MCGGELEISDGMSVATCDYCGTKQTVPTVNEDEIRALFNRANVLRMKGEFDKSEKIYEKIIERNGREAEAYWGVVLCRYGIEYVEDPKSYKRIPTCHRTSYEAITADTYYDSALTYADAVQRTVYEAEARAIDTIQKNILAICGSEAPYDVFICYKETDELMRRTKDSAVADEIYYELTNMGYKVFFAPVTLKSKLGSEYEPYIFAALSSAKVLLAIGTRPEYFNAVWVKNEWSRFLKMMRNDRSKKLIPCYRDMDAYELPEEFAHLQALNMSEIGFIRELTRGIQNIIVREQPKSASVKHQTQTVIIKKADGTVVSDASASVRRGFLFLEDGDFKSAVTYFEKALDINPEYGMAYLGKAMAELKLCITNEVKGAIPQILDNVSFKHAFEYDNGEVEQAVGKYVKEYKARLAREKAEQESRLEEERIAKEESERKKREEFEANAARMAAARRKADSVSDLIHAMGRGYAGNVLVCKPDGTVSFKHYQKDQGIRDTKGADELRRVKKVSGFYALLYDGTVKRFHTSWLAKAENTAFTEWRDIVDIDSCAAFIIGYKKDGSFVVDGSYAELAAEASAWTDIKSLHPFGGRIIGVKNDGTLVFVGENVNGVLNVKTWTDIKNVVQSFENTYGIKNDGTVVACGVSKYGRCDVKDWTDIIDVLPREGYDYSAPIGLKRDGTVVMKGGIATEAFYKWTDIVKLYNYGSAIVGLKADGTVVYDYPDGNIRALKEKNRLSYYNNYNTQIRDSESYRGKEIANLKLSELNGWTDIVELYPYEGGYSTDSHIWGVKKDGTVVATGSSPIVSIAKDFRLWQSFETVEADRQRAMAQRASEDQKAEEEARRKEEARLAKEAAERERARKEREKRAAEQAKRDKYKSMGKCQYCGGEFKGFFAKKCLNCGRSKDY